MNFKRNLFALSLPMLLGSCAVLRHVQIGEVDNRSKGQYFEVAVSEVGINTDEATEILKLTTRNYRTNDVMDGVNAIIQLFQMGPTTGNMVFNESYADTILEKIAKKCPNGTITGLASIRESNKYPVVSGEIVKVTGYCVHSF